MSFAVHAAMFSRELLSTFLWTSHVYSKCWLSYFWPMCRVIAPLAKEQLEMFALNATFPDIVSNYDAIMRMAFNKTLWGDCLHFGHRLSHNSVTASFAMIKTNTYNPIQTEARECNKHLTGEKYELLLPNALNTSFMTEKDLKFRIKYLEYLLYRDRLFVFHVKRSYKVPKELRTLQKR